MEGDDAPRLGSQVHPHTPWAPGRVCRTYVIGDVHGCYDELQDLEDLARRQAASEGAEAFFVLVGDLVDRGPRSRDVVAHVRKGFLAGTHACVAGNHEAFLVEVVLAHAPWNFEGSWPLQSRKPCYSIGVEARYLNEGALATGMGLDDFKAQCRMRWMRSGGRETLVSFGCDPDNSASWHLDPELLAFLVGLPLLWESDLAVVTHALGAESDLSVGRDLTRRAREDMAGFHSGLTAREHKVIEKLLWCREMPKEAPAPGKLHVTGHTPLEMPSFDASAGVVNVDTACVFGGMLTALCLETGAFISVPGWKGSPYA